MCAAIVALQACLWMASLLPCRRDKLASVSLLVAAVSVWALRFWL